MFRRQVSCKWIFDCYVKLPKGIQHVLFVCFYLDHEFVGAKHKKGGCFIFIFHPGMINIGIQQDLCSMLPCNFGNINRKYREDISQEFQKRMACYHVFFSFRLS